MGGGATAPLPNIFWGGATAPSAPPPPPPLPAPMRKGMKQRYNSFDEIFEIMKIHQMLTKRAFRIITVHVT